VVNQVIHYIYEDGSTARPDHVSVKIVFTQTGVKNLATNSTIWNGDWTKTQTFVVVKSPEIEGYTADREEVGPYD
ncbi:mucin-binding protein, partial [Lactobacillus crispatus]|uniref:mucin-binding protein n=1 Tax=Lactobacillus crispatus TaxID=47770 RepID=UPI00127B76DF